MTTVHENDHDLTSPITVPTDGCTWTKNIRVHTVGSRRVVGYDDGGQEIELEYDWLGRPTQEQLAEMRLDVRDRWDREAIDWMARQWVNRNTDDA